MLYTSRIKCYREAAICLRNVFVKLVVAISWLIGEGFSFQLIAPSNTFEKKRLQIFTLKELELKFCKDGLKTVSSSVILSIECVHVTYSNSQIQTEVKSRHIGGLKRSFNMAAPY